MGVIFTHRRFLSSPGYETFLQLRTKPFKQQLKKKGIPVWIVPSQSNTKTSNEPLYVMGGRDQILILLFSLVPALISQSCKARQASERTPRGATLWSNKETDQHPQNLSRQRQSADSCFELHSYAQSQPFALCTRSSLFSHEEAVSRHLLKAFLPFFILLCGRTPGLGSFSEVIDHLHSNPLVKVRIHTPSSNSQSYLSRDRVRQEA